MRLMNAVARPSSVGGCSASSSSSSPLLREKIGNPFGMFGQYEQQRGDGSVDGDVCRAGE